MTRNKYFAFGAVFCVCLFHIFANMGYLVRDGRLSVVPLYDDVTYLVDGMGRFAVLSRAGIGGFIADLYAHPAHAPFMAVTSAFGFLFSGGEIWGAYALNALWILVVAVLLLQIVREVDGRSGAGIVVALLAVPLFGLAVIEYRPDPVWGLLVGLSATLLVTIDIARAGTSRLVMLGLLIGAAVISKPTAAPASVVVIFAAYVGQLVSSFLLLPSLPKRALVRGSLFLAIGAAVVVIPYAIVSGAEIISYIRMVYAGGSVWHTKATLVEHITFYLRQSMGVMMLGWVWYAVLPVSLLCLALLIRSKDRRGLSAFVGILLAISASYAILTLSSMKTHMIGSLLYGSIIGAMAWSSAQIVRNLPIRHSIVLILGVLIFITQWMVPQSGLVQRKDPAMQTTDAASKAAFPVVLEALRTHTNKGVVVMDAGPVFSATLDFLLRQKEGIVASFQEGWTWDTFEPYKQAVASCDVVIISDTGMRGQSGAYNFPSAKFQKQLLQHVRDSNEFVENIVFTDELNRSVRVFVRKLAKAGG